MISGKWLVTALVYFFLETVPTTAALNPFPGDIEYIFAFGDSYTDVGFNVTSPLHPNPSNFIGNPVLPGVTADVVSNYIEDICSEYNRSLIYLYDFAHLGAIVNSSLISPYESVNNTFTYQVDNEFLPYLAPKPSYAPWNSDNSLFTVLFGINDIDRAFGGEDPFVADWDSLLPSIMDTYWNYVNKLVTAGARNFAFLNLPTYWRSPDVVNRGNATLTAIAKQRTLLWNSQLASRHQSFQSTHPDVVSKIVDLQGLWEDMYKFPSRYGFTNVTDYCPAYFYGTGTNLTAFDPSCSAPVNQYLWLNTLHPTWPVHRYMAKLVLETIGYLPGGVKYD